MSKFLTGFKYAFAGICRLLATQRNAQVQLAAAVMVVGAGFYFGITQQEWITITLCIVLVLAAEGINTAVENLADALHPEQHPLIGKAKDVAAGAVLLIAIGAAIVGVIIFLPYLRASF